MQRDILHMIDPRARPLSVQPGSNPDSNPQFYTACLCVPSPVLTMAQDNSLKLLTPMESFLFTAEVKTAPFMPFKCVAKPNVCVLMEATWDYQDNAAFKPS